MRATLVPCAIHARRTHVAGEAPGPQGLCVAMHTRAECSRSEQASQQTTTEYISD